MLRNPKDCFKCGKELDIEYNHWVRIVQFYFHFTCWQKVQHELAQQLQFSQDEMLKPSEEHYAIPRNSDSS